MAYIDVDALRKIKFHPLPYQYVVPSDVDKESYVRGWNDVIDGIIEGMPTADVPERNVGKWIPVTERLPGYGNEVLTINADGDYEVNHIMDDENGEWFWDGVVAWMPLPEPYRKETEDG